MPETFMVSPTVILRCEPQYYDTYIAFDYRRGRSEFLSREEFRVLEYIYDRTADLQEICRETGFKREACEKFLKRMAWLGYVKVNLRENEIKPLERIRIDPEAYRTFPLPFLSAPASVDIFITGRCNLRCVHCFSSDGGSSTELSFGELKSIFDQLERIGVLEVRINGGEPFLHPNIREILMNLKSRRFRKVILTNGTLLDEESVSLLKEAGIIPTVSLDSATAEEHDSFRGVEGSFKRTLEALELLKKKRMLYGINCCLHRKNLKSYEKIVKLAWRHGAYRISFLDLKTVGRMRENLDWLPSYGEYKAIALEIHATKFKYRKRIDVSLDVFLHCPLLRESLWEARNGYVSCQAGRSRLSIDSDGYVYPCNLVLSDPLWRMGDISRSKIIDVWFSEKWLFFRGGVKISDLKKCKTCKHLWNCRDFYCRLLPYITSGDRLAPHPKCLNVF